MLPAEFKINPEDSKNLRSDRSPSSSGVLSLQNGIAPGFNRLLETSDSLESDADLLFDMDESEVLNTTLASAFVDESTTSRVASKDPSTSRSFTSSPSGAAPKLGSTTREASPASPSTPSAPKVIISPEVEARKETLESSINVSRGTAPRGSQDITPLNRSGSLAAQTSLAMMTQEGFRKDKIALMTSIDVATPAPMPTMDSTGDDVSPPAQILPKELPKELVESSVARKTQGEFTPRTTVLAKAPEVKSLEAKPLEARTPDEFTQRSEFTPRTTILAKAPEARAPDEFTQRSEFTPLTTVLAKAPEVKSLEARTPDEFTQRSEFTPRTTILAKAPEVRTPDEFTQRSEFTPRTTILAKAPEVRTPDEFTQRSEFAPRTTVLAKAPEVKSLEARAPEVKVPSEFTERVNVKSTTYQEEVVLPSRPLNNDEFDSSRQPSREATPYLSLRSPQTREAPHEPTVEDDVRPSVTTSSTSTTPPPVATPETSVDSFNTRAQPVGEDDNVLFEEESSETPTTNIKPLPPEHRGEMQIAPPSVSAISSVQSSTATNSVAPTQDLTALVTEIAAHISSMHLSDRVDTTLTLQNPPLFAGAQITIQQHKTAAGEFSVSFHGLSNEAASLILNRSNQAILQENFERRGLTIHILQVAQSIAAQTHFTTDGQSATFKARNREDTGNESWDDAQDRRQRRQR